MPGNAPSEVNLRGASAASSESAVRQELRPTGENPIVFVSSFADFYQVHYQKIAGALAVTLGNPDLGAEAADEAMARAYGKWAEVSSYANPSGWVYRVGLNWGRSWHRRASRRLPWQSRHVVELPETTDPALRQAIEKLDPKYRSVVVCRYFLDWSTDQTAEALDIRPGTVKSRLSKALDLIRTQVQPDLSSGPSGRG